MNEEWPTYPTAKILVSRCLYRYRHLDPDLQDDLEQEGLIAAWGAYEEHGADVKRAFVSRIIERRMIDFLRKFGRLVPGRPTRQHRQRPLPVMVELSECDAAVQPVFAERVELITFIQCLLRGLDNHKLRLIGNICYPDDYTYAPETFGVTRGWIQAKQRALRVELDIKAYRLGWYE